MRGMRGPPKKDSTRRTCKWRGCTDFAKFGSKYCRPHTTASLFHGGAVLAPDVRHVSGVEHQYSGRLNEIDGAYRRFGRGP